QFTLPNGLRVILHEDHSVPLVTVNMWYHVGSARERPGRTGFAHLFEHLMFMGSGHVKPGQFDEWLEAAGGDNNGSTANDRTNYYGPSNASLVVAGDIESASARTLVEKWFADVKPGAQVDPMTIPGVALSGVQKKTIADKVQLPRLTLAWLTPPSFAPGDAALDVVGDVLAGGKNSRLYKRLVYDLQIAQSVVAGQNSQALSSYFIVQATPRPGHTLDEIEKVMDEEIGRLQNAPPSQHELDRSLNQIEASFYNRMERVGGFGGKGDQLNAYYTATGHPDWLNEELARYRALSPSDIQAAAAQFLPHDRRVELTVMPDGGTNKP